jgi:hypothetical protein
MTDFERINGPRVEKIVKMLEVIETSAKSNKAMDELAALLAPVSRKLGQAPYQTLGQAMSQNTGQAPSQETGQAPSQKPDGRRRTSTSARPPRARTSRT